MGARPFGQKYTAKQRLLLGTCLVLSMSAVASGAGQSRLVAENTGAGSKIVVGAQGGAVTDSEKQSFAKDAVNEMQGYVKALSDRIEDARRAKNIALLNQLNDAYGSISALLKVAQTSQVLLEDAILQNNALQAEHQYRKIVIARAKAQQIYRASEGFSADDDELQDTDDGDVKVLVDIDAAINPYDIGTDPSVDPGDTFPAPPPSPPAG